MPARERLVVTSKEHAMKTSRLLTVTVIAMAAALFLTQAAAGDEAKKAAGIAADALKWEEMSAKAPGVKIATVSGDYTKSAWAGFVKFPAGSKSGVHTHSSDLKIVVVSGTFRYGDNPETEKNYGAGSYILIPANLPHSNSQPEGALLYGEQPDKFDNKPVQ
jgi:quercetin dioxygenase-like cupin family protein